jgi:pro-apoptotic serine protease NMA111
VSSNMNGTLATGRSKRKQPPFSGDERPQKQYRAVNGKVSPGENTPDIEMGGVPGLIAREEDEDIGAAYQAQPADTAEWQETVQKVISSVVSIRFCQTCAFDTDSALTSEATGFVVDAENGLVQDR